MRQKPKNMQLMEILQPRMTFSHEQDKRLNDYKIGFEGETAADDAIDPQLDNCLILNDLCLHSSRFCQIDKLIIAPSHIHLLEIKNYGGTFIYKDGNFFNRNMAVRDNPFLQLERTEQQLRSFTQGFAFPIQARLVMMNPTFQLHGSTVEMPFIQRHQLDRFINYVANDQNVLTGSHYELHRHLRESHREENPYEQLMPFDFAELSRGIFCDNCQRGMQPFTTKIFRCSFCGFTKTKQQVVEDSSYELGILFGQDRVKPKLIQDWIGNQIHRRNIQRALRRLDNNG